ncbi:MAG: cyclic pyranopterin monophosphate synthase MoaC [Planctomycetes bacterium]|nr:cyclic pyranopterin monophosphate synthase MoaC [Planctomycetota bacterium]MCB9918113.1 cyclic pyranopterin monophosphate synthase MoaC [Planctomycetota bacterium]
MVDVGAKKPTRRVAVAECHVRLGEGLFAALLGGALPKGDALAVARVAGIQAAKRTSETIPLCHSLSLDYVRIEFEPDAATSTLRILCEAATTAGTGVEMEALCGASGAALTIYDMGKALSRGIVVDSLRLLRKEGGRSGVWTADDGEGLQEGAHGQFEDLDEPADEPERSER